MMQWKKNSFFLILFITFNIYSTPPAGLTNCGNTCFQNAALQLFYQIDPFRDLFLRSDIRFEPNSIEANLKRLISLMHQKQGSIVTCDPGSVLDKFTLQAAPICTARERGAQSDPNNFFAWFENDPIFSNNPNFTPLLKRSEIVNVDIADVGIRIIKRPIGMKFVFSMPLIESDRGNRRYLTTAIDQSSNYIKKLYYDEQTDKNYADVSVKLIFETYPPFFLFQLNRSPAGFTTISRDPVEVPDLLDLSTYMPPKEPVILYELRGFTLHSGTLGGGHWTAIVKHTDDNWYRCDDLQTAINKTGIFLITKEQALEQARNGFIFLYVAQKFAQPPRYLYEQLKVELNTLKRRLDKLTNIIKKIQ